MVASVVGASVAVVAVVPAIISVEASVVISVAPNVSLVNCSILRVSCFSTAINSISIIGSISANLGCCLIVSWLIQGIDTAKPNIRQP